MKTKILLFKVGKGDTRKICELIENMTFNNKEELKEVLKNLKFSGYGEIMELTDFMDACNDDADWLHDYFISYVHFKTDN